MINCSSTVQRIIDRLLFRDVDIADDSGWTPLIIASSAGHIDIVHMLVEKGAKVTDQSEITLTLINSGFYFQVNEVTTEGRSALLYAASKGREEIVRFLMTQVKLASNSLFNDQQEILLVGGGREQS